MEYRPAILTAIAITILLITGTNSSACRSSWGNESGKIYSPNYPSNYGNHQTCHWVLTVEDGYLIKLVFEGIFETENVNDYIKVTDIHPRSGREMRSQSFSGTQRPDPYVSTTSNIRVNFKTDGSVINRGFSAFWTKFARPCGHRVTGENGSITYPQDDINYPDIHFCSTNISVPLGKFIFLEFISTFDLDVEDSNNCIGDEIEVFDVMGDDSLISRGSWCWSDRPPVLTSFGSKMVLTLHRRGILNGQNVSAEWHAVSDCGGEFKELQGNIMSYDYPVDRRSSDVISAIQNCTWDIFIPDPYHTIISFHRSMNDSDCQDIEILEYSESDNQLLPRLDWCVPKVNEQNETSLSDVMSSSSKIRLVYRQGENTGHGLFVSWKTECGQNFSTMTGNLSTPGYGIEYPPNLNCEWVIEGVEDRSVRLDFRSPFDIEMSNDKRCGYDYVEVLERMPGGNLVSQDRFCGTKPPQQHISSSKTLIVRFHSDENKNGKGFTASWETKCGDVYKTLQGNVTTPRFPSPYPHNIDCRWEIKAPEGHVINLSFNTQFSLEGNSRCDADYLEVYDYTRKGKLSKRGRWCGQDTPPLQTSLTSRMVLLFHSDSTKNDFGFQAEWESECGGDLYSSRGTFTSPGFPQPHPADLRCRWKIQVTQGQRVKLVFWTILDIDIDEEDCSYNGVEVLDSLSNGTLISQGKWCSVRQLPIFYSTSSSVVVSFYSNSDKNSRRYKKVRGFSASWESVSGCDETTTKRNGHLLSPNFPSNYPEYQQCRWEIKPPTGTPAGTQNVTLHFDPEFDIEVKDDCSWDYVEIHRGDEFLGRWCGTDAPPDVTSVGQTVVVVFKSDKSIAGKGFIATWDWSHAWVDLA